MMVDYELPRVVAVRHVREHVLWIRFADAVEGEVDLSDGLRGEMFEPLKDSAKFAEVSIEYNTLAWPNRADWAAETLYERVRAGKGRASRSIGNAPEQGSAYIAGMPEISRFFGIVVRMLANEHAPSHFHGTYGEYEISVTIGDGVVAGRFPARALRLLLEWRDLHRDELEDNWNRFREGRAPVAIAPLA